MSEKELQSYEGLCSCLDEYPNSQRDFPFGVDVLVFKLKGKIFALMSWQDDPIRLSLKCDPEEAIKFRILYSAITPGYHLNKRHWNTVTCDGSVPDVVIREMIHHSYQLVRAGLPVDIRKQIPEAEGSIVEQCSP